MGFFGSTERIITCIKGKSTYLSFRPCKRFAVPLPFSIHSRTNHACSELTWPGMNLYATPAKTDKVYSTGPV